MLYNKIPCCISISLNKRPNEVNQLPVKAHNFLTKSMKIGASVNFIRCKERIMKLLLQIRPASIIFFIYKRTVISVLLGGITGM